MGLAFLACVEHGVLEPQAVLLCRSIRRFGGRYRDAPIYTFQPRLGHDPSSATARELDRLGVIRRTEVLNRDFADYPVGNKIFACARAEETLGEDVLVFLDSDTILTGEPADLDLPAGIDAAVRPAHSVGHNCSGPGHPMAPYWRRVDALFGIEDVWDVETELGTVTRAYFSAGLIAARRRAGLFGRWREDFLRLVGEGCLPVSGIARADEISLAVTLLRVFDRVRILDGRYNYLIFKRDQLPSPWDSVPLEHLVHVHYRRAFNRDGFVRGLRPPLPTGGEVFAWLAPHLPLPEPGASPDRS